MLNCSKYIIFLIGFSLSFSVFSQTKEDLKTKKINLEKEINSTEKELKTTESNKKESEFFISSLDQKIKKQQEKLKNLNEKIMNISDSIIKTKIIIDKTAESILKKEENLQYLKNEYVKMIYACFKKQGNDADLMFVISAEDFNESEKRVFYIKQYASFRTKQTIKIAETQRELEVKKDSLSAHRDRLILESESKQFLINKKKNELIIISNTRQEKEELIKSLSKSEILFKKQLQDKHKKAKDLDDEIRKIIEEEMRKAREEAEKNNKGFALTPESIALSSEFNSNKGKLPWPLEKGVIVQGYGKQKHAVFNGIETFNNGIDIATDKNAIVRAVFAGTISRIFFIKGEGKAILMNHGEYFSVYSRLKDASVKVGDKLLAKEKIGTVLTQKEEEKTELHFEIWKGRDKHDPSKWLYKAY